VINHGDSDLLEEKKPHGITEVLTIEFAKCIDESLGIFAFMGSFFFSG
jgi:hypothetical protein